MKRYNKPTTQVVKIEIDQLMQPASPTTTPGVGGGTIGAGGIESKEQDLDGDGLWED